MHDVLIIGGGVVGLSLAWDLARHGQRVHLIDQSEPGREASWAGAGILPPAKLLAHQHPSDQLRGLACELHPEWAAELTRLTQIDTGYRKCGGIYLARTAGEAAALVAWKQMATEEGIAVSQLDAEELCRLEPGLAWQLQSLPLPLGEGRGEGSRQSRPASFANILRAALHLPGEAQLRNPRHLQALLAACVHAGVTITSHVTAADFAVENNELHGIQTASGLLRARQFCFTAGAWTGQILQRLGIAAGILPIRGQIVLFKCDKPPITRIINEGSRYLVPREDGRLLAGSTEEEVGFDKRTTAEAIADLTAFAKSLVPALENAEIERTWAGLRPGSFDGLPYLGPLPNLTNAYVAAGHFRTGLYLSPATAVVMSQLIRGETPQIDLAPFLAGR